MCTSSVFVGPHQCSSQTSSMICSRRTAAPGSSASRASRSNSFGVRRISSSSIHVHAGACGGRCANAPTVQRRTRPATRSDRTCRRTPAHGADARDELAEPERLHHVVVGTELEQQHPVELVAARREHDDRHVGAGAQRAGRRRRRRRRGTSTRPGGCSRGSTRSRPGRDRRGRARQNRPLPRLPGACREPAGTPRGPLERGRRGPARRAQRLGRWESAAALAEETGQPGRAALLRRLAESEVVWRIQGPARVELPWIRCWPVPIVKAKINGQSVLLGVDTGVTDLVLDPWAARHCDVTLMPEQMTILTGAARAWSRAPRCCSASSWAACGSRACPSRPPRCGAGASRPIPRARAWRA